MQAPSHRHRARKIAHGQQLAVQSRVGRDERSHLPITPAGPQDRRADVNDPVKGLQPVASLVHGEAGAAAELPGVDPCTHQVTQVSGRQTSGGGLRHAEHAMLVSQRLPSVHGLTLRLGQRSVQRGTAPLWTA
jgi:hypothetical protein